MKNLKDSVQSTVGFHVEFMMFSSSSALFTGYHKSHGPLVVKALPTSRPNKHEEVRHEIEMLRRCESQYIARLCLASTGPQFTVIATERCERGDLFEYLHSHQPSRRFVKVCLAQIGIALNHLHHASGVIHEDLKPENIGITSCGQIKLLDLGCAVVAKKEGVVCTAGTVQYASPEKLQRLPHSFDADWWAYGVLMFELITGSLPFDADTQESTAMKVCTQDIENILKDEEKQLSSGKLVRKLLARSKKSRFVDFDIIKADPFFADVEFEVVHDVRHHVSPSHQ